MKEKWAGFLADFNLTEETEDTCELCKIKVPRELNFIGPVCIGDEYKDLCPKCSKGIRNLLLKQPVNTMFPSEDVNRLYYRFISWLTQQED